MTAAAAAVKPAAASSAPVDGLTAAQQSIAQTIISEGKRLKQTPKQILTALTVGVDESGLQNYSNAAYTGAQPGTTAVGHDHGSVGVFQQQSGQVPGSGANWGTVAELENPAIAADKFYAALDGKSDQGSSVSSLAQEVQQSGTADGSNYAAVEPRAAQIFNALYGKTAAGTTYLAGIAGSGTGTTPTATSTTNSGAATATLTGIPLGDVDKPWKWSGDIQQGASNVASGAAKDSAQAFETVISDLWAPLARIFENGALVLFGLVLIIVGLVIIAHAASDSDSGNSNAAAAGGGERKAEGKESAEEGSAAGGGGAAADVADAAVLA